MEAIYSDEIVHLQTDSLWLNNGTLYTTYRVLMPLPQPQANQCTSIGTAPLQEVFIQNDVQRRLLISV